MPTVVLLLPKRSYNGDDFFAAAKRLGFQVFAASDRCRKLAEVWGGETLALPFRDPEIAAQELAERVRELRPAAVVGTDDQTAIIAARAAAHLGLAHNPIEAVEAARDKSLSREKLRAAGVPVPWFEVFSIGATANPTPTLAGLAERVPYPCVVKPLILSASRGVIRADDPGSFLAAAARLAALLRHPQVSVRRDEALERILVEEFLPGPEVALEGILAGGHLEVLAIFDKPEPLDGPFFEETLYVTPSRHGQDGAIAAMAERGARALGLREGPVHAELRLTPGGPRILEVAARSIGGLCGRTLRFGLGVTLEELILSHAAGQPVRAERERRAAGVMMLPIPRRGVLKRVEGVEAARAGRGIEDVIITAHLDEELVPLPEGESYLGFMFARAGTPEQVEAALRQAQRELKFEIAPVLEVRR